MAEQSPVSRREAEARLTAKAWTDGAFAEALRMDPKAAIERELGSTLPADVTVTVLEETPTEFYVVIPAKPAGPDGEELSDAELEQAAGGGGGLMQLVAYGSQDVQ